MTVKNRSYFSVDSSELAQWLRNEGGDSWWTVDGDPYLMERISFPCRGEDLADLLEATQKTAVLFDKDKSSGARGETLTAAEIGARVAVDDDDNRVVELHWKDSPDWPWLLIEDRGMEDLFRTLQAGDD